MKQKLTYLMLTLMLSFSVVGGVKAWTAVGIYANFNGSPWQNYSADEQPESDSNVWNVQIDFSSIAAGTYYLKVLGQSDQYFGGEGGSIDVYTGDGSAEYFTKGNGQGDDIAFIHNAKYAKYNFKITWYDDYRWKIEVTGVEAPSTTYSATLNYGAGTSTVTTASPFKFTIPQSAYDSSTGVSFSMAVSATTSGSTTTKYYAASSTITDRTAVSVTEQGSATNTTYKTDAADAPTGDLTVTLDLSANTVKISHPTASSSATAYYLIGDLTCLGITAEDKYYNGWGTDLSWGTNGLYRILKFTDNGDGTYSLRIPACRPNANSSDANNYKKAGTTWQTTDKPVSFVVAPEEAFTSGSEDKATSKWTGDFDWTKVIRPDNNDKWIASSYLSGSTTTGSSSNNFKAQINSGSYTFTINPSASTWSATYDEGVRIMYVAVKENGYWRANQYIIDEVTGDAFDGQHWGSFSTDGKGILILHNWYAWQTDGSQTGWGGFSCRPYLQPMTFYSDANTDLSPVSRTTLDTKYITNFNVAGKYYTGVDPSNGSPSEIYSGMNPRPYGNFVGQLGEAALQTVPVVMPAVANKVIRTYSNVVDLTIPEHYKAYVAHSFDKNNTEGKAENGTVNLRQIKYIPKNVGVVLVGENVSYAGTVDFPKYTGTKYYDTDNRPDLWTLKGSKYSDVSGNDEFNNYLIGSNDVSVDIKNYVGEDENNPSTYTARNFGLNVYSKTKNGVYAGVTEGSDDDFIGFFRAEGTVPPNYAYLQLPSDKDSKFGYMDYNGQILDDQPDDQAESLSKTFITFDDELYAEEIANNPTENETTAISHISGQRTTDNAYYTLMGAKVEHPTKGIYIHNGKKVVIK